jgi:hypothetical protein
LLVHSKSSFASLWILYAINLGSIELHREELLFGLRHVTDVALKFEEGEGDTSKAGV